MRSDMKRNLFFGARPVGRSERWAFFISVRVLKILELLFLLFYFGLKSGFYFSSLWSAQLTFTTYSNCGGSVKIGLVFCSCSCGQPEGGTFLFPIDGLKRWACSFVSQILCGFERSVFFCARPWGSAVPFIAYLSRLFICAQWFKKWDCFRVLLRAWWLKEMGLFWVSS